MQVHLFHLFKFRTDVQSNVKGERKQVGQLQKGMR